MTDFAFLCSAMDGDESLDAVNEWHLDRYRYIVSVATVPDHDWCGFWNHVWVPFVVPKLLEMARQERGQP